MTDTTFTPDHWGPNVRRVRDTDGLTLLCQERDARGQWVTFYSTNEMSNDWAYTETSSKCRSRASKYMGGH